MFHFKKRRFHRNPLLSLSLIRNNSSLIMTFLVMHVFIWRERRVKRPNVSEWHFWTKTSSTKFWHFLLLRCSRYHMRPYVLSWFVERIENEGRKAKHLLNPLFLIFLFYFWGKNQWQALNSSNPVRNSINARACTLQIPRSSVWNQTSSILIESNFSK